MCVYSYGAISAFIIEPEDFAGDGISIKKPYHIPYAVHQEMDTRLREEKESTEALTSPSTQSISNV